MNATATLTTIAAAEDDNIYCDCGAALTDAELDECGSICAKCHAETHFVCTDCDGSSTTTTHRPRARRAAELPGIKGHGRARGEAGRAQGTSPGAARQHLNDANLRPCRRSWPALKRLQPDVIPAPGLAGDVSGAYDTEPQEGATSMCTAVLCESPEPCVDDWKQEQQAKLERVYDPILPPKDMLRRAAVAELRRLNAPAADP